MRTTCRVPLAGGVGAIVFEANSENDVVMVSVGDGAAHPVKASELGHAFYLIASATKPDHDPNSPQLVQAIRPRFP